MGERSSLGPPPPEEPTASAPDDGAPPPTRESDAVLARRAQLLDLDPYVEDIFLASICDGQPGMKRTYSFLRPRRTSILLGSSVMLLIVVNACVVGLLVGSAVLSAGGAFEWATGAGIAAGLLFSAGFMVFGGVGFRWAWTHYAPRRITPAALPPPTR